MNGRHRRTLQAVFHDPVSGSIVWDDIESLLVAVGCTIIEGNGSHVRFEKDGKLAFFHRPHPEKEAKRYKVKDTRRFLQLLGVEP
ncbi:type II toxin-antitoxin system HicA family toxin [Rhizobium sp. BG4]|uniref:type II toxin-antitoxin system HicA family toxin n=1 Tax=Rhizobium sp. BG4 TaxID=2613770 RepID=UPI00193E686C|nr:type II toxin-antitoxin system HicA family toxin [Rhizobium sp. BG4]QRM47130.1 type II toxin-antitoxin system HicA family toxin [Rhizobium sp. BG4]